MKVHRLSDTAALPPGTLIHVGPRRTQATKVSLVLYDQANLSQIDDPPLDQLAQYAARPGGVTWVRVEGLAQVEVIEAVGKAFCLHPLVQEDIVNTAQRPKVEDYGDYLYLALRCPWPEDEEGGWRPEQVSLVLGKGWALSFQESHAPLFKPVAERLETAQGRIRRQGPDYLAYALLDTVMDAFFPALEGLGDQAEALEDELLGAATAAALKRLHQLKRQSLALRRALWPMREVLSTLERLDTPLIQSSTDVYLRDVYDHAVQLMDTAETLRDSLSGMLDIHLSSVSNRLNEVMKVLTIIATIFMPLSFIAGVYGMNFERMPELKWPWGYPLALGLMAAVAAVMLAYFRRKKWI